MSKVKCIGIIAEDNSDFEAVKVLIARIIDRDNFSFKRRVGNGCGRVKQNALKYAKNLNNRGCDMLILIHDLDKNNLAELLKKLQNKIKDAPFDKKFVCIPIEELEAWFLSDPVSIKTTFNLKRQPKFSGLPETVNSPKEVLADQISKCSDKQINFLPINNKIIAANVNLDLIKEKCPSFDLLHTFLLKYKYK